ncbi:putative oligoendopeptidase F [Bacillus phage vB_BspM_AgentSmith]|nr:putative oligoendopeptidase F [Bacillus phage vB_BspM_AgentSmith]
MEEVKTEHQLRELIRTNPGAVNWDNVSYHQTLSEEFIREFQTKLDWYGISFNQKLSEEFIREFQDKVNWRGVSYRQSLSEEFIREFQDKVNWEQVSQQQTLSEEFIREFQDKLNLEIIFTVQDYSEDFELMKVYTQNNPDLLRVTKIAINKELLEKLEACEDGVVCFLEHTKPDESIDWFELKRRHKWKSDLSWLFERLV